MAHAVPKIHFNITQMNGDTTLNSDTITNIASTAGAVVGMSVSGPNIPFGTTIIALTTLTIQMSKVATASATIQAIETYYKIDFDYPPVEPKGEKLSPQERRSLSLTGLSQVSIDFVEGIRDLDFRFLSDSLYTQVSNFYSTWAVYGLSFRLYDDRFSSPYFTYELRNFDYAPEKIAPKATSYVWAVKMQLRRVV